MTLLKKQLLSLFILGFILLMSSLPATSQAPDYAQLSVHYKFTWVRDTTNRARPYTENLVLLIGKKATVYKSSEEHRSAAEFYQYPNEKIMLRKEKILMSGFLIKDLMPAINWKISKDTASLGGLHCQKATAHFKGREYTAWFCSALPLHAGPWKLNGLPGVIVQACDSKNEVCFNFNGIEKLATPAVIEVPSDGTPATEKEFNRLQETFRKDPEAFLRMVAAQGDGSGREMKIDMKPGPGPIINNPIELPEKN
jgi:hypothetical protein